MFQSKRHFLSEHIHNCIHQCAFGRTLVLETLDYFQCILVGNGEIRLLHTNQQIIQIGLIQFRRNLQFPVYFVRRRSILPCRIVTEKKHIPHVPAVVNTAPAFSMKLNVLPKQNAIKIPLANQTAYANCRFFDRKRFDDP